MTLTTDEFIRRFLIHVLPKGFHRIRHYGLLANANRAANIAHARQLLAVPSRPKQPETPKASDRRTPRAAASMSVLRWPHDRHRDFRARLRAEAPARATSSGNQDRHLMMPSPPIDDSYHTCHPRWLAAGRDQTRIRPLDWPVSAPQIPSATCRPLVHPDALILALQQTDRGNRSCPTSSSPAPRLNPHSARRTAAEPPTAISCLGAFPTPAARACGLIRNCRRPKTCT